MKEMMFIVKKCFVNLTKACLNVLQLNLEGFTVRKSEIVRQLIKKLGSVTNITAN